MKRLFLRRSVVPPILATPVTGFGSRTSASSHNNDSRSLNVSGMAAAKRPGGGYKDEEPADWKEPTLEDLDRSIPQVDCEFMSKLIRSRTARLARYRREQHQTLGKLQAHYMSQRSDKKGLASQIMNSDEEDLINKGVLTREEWDTFNHSRPEYDDGFVIMDVRTVNEITSWGIIEGSKVLPAHELYDAFKLTPEDFESEFGFAKPHPSQKIIFYCQFGPRSLMAAQILSYLGYPHILHLRDGYHEWAKQYNLLLRRWFEDDARNGTSTNRAALFQAAKELQREIAPEFNELPMLEAQRLIVDETRSRGAQQIGEGLRSLCYKQVEELTSGLTPEDVKLPPSLNDAMSQLRIESGQPLPTAGSYNATASSQNMMDFLAQTTGLSSDNDTNAEKARQTAARESSTAVDSPVNDFSIEDPTIVNRRP